MRALNAALALSPVALVAAHLAPNLYLKPYGRRVFPVLDRIPTSDAVALTFDDGPDASLEAFLRALERAQARATFFVVGEQVRRAPERVREILAAGHEVGLHCDRHRRHLTLTPWQVIEDLRRAQATIEDAAGQPVRLYRPPYGLFNLASWVESGRRGWERVLWRRWGWDWAEDATADSIAATVGRPDPGDIILLHDSDRYGAPGSWRRTLAALPRILDTAAGAGLSARPVGELLSRSRHRGWTTNGRAPGVVRTAGGTR